MSSTNSTITIDTSCFADVAQLAGPTLLGYFFLWGLYGILTVQVYIYHLTSEGDTPFRKWMVYGLYLVETVQTVLATHDGFFALGSGWGNCAALNAIEFTWFHIPVLTGVTSAAVQCYYAWQIMKLTGSKILGGIIAALALAQGSAGVAAGIQLHLVNNFAQLQEKTFKATIVWHVGAAMCDIIIAGTMVYFLYKNQGTFKRTNKLLSTLIKLTVETGLITAGVAILDLIIFLVFKHNDFHNAPASTLSKLYTNTLLALFNHRIAARNGGWTSMSTPSHAIASNAVHIPMTPRDFGRSLPTRSGINVEVTQEIYGEDLTGKMTDTRRTSDPESPIDREFKAAGSGGQYSFTPTFDDTPGHAV